MMLTLGKGFFIRCPSPDFNHSSAGKLGFLKPPVAISLRGTTCGSVRSSLLSHFKVMEASKASSFVNVEAYRSPDVQQSGCLSNDIDSRNAHGEVSGIDFPRLANCGSSTNIAWHKCSVNKCDREELLQQKGCVIWVTGLSGSGKSSLACALGHALHAKSKLTYILDGDNVRHGLNSDLSFGAKDRTENIRRIGEVAKLFADAGIICIASLISPFRKERDACRALLPEGEFIEVFMDVPLHVCEARDPKGLYKLARAGKIKGFTGIDDPYEPPLNAEIVLHQKVGVCDSPADLAEIVVSYLEEKGYLEA